MKFDRRNPGSYCRQLVCAIFLGLTLMYVLSLAGAGYAILYYEKYLGSASPVQRWLNRNAASYTTDIYHTMLAMKEVSIAFREMHNDKTSFQSQQHFREQAELLAGMLATFELNTSIGQLVQSYTSTDDAIRNAKAFLGLLSRWADSPDSISELEIRQIEETAFTSMRRLTMEAEQKEFQARDDLVIAINSSRALAERALEIGIVLFIFGFIALVSVYLAAKDWVAAERERFERLEYLISTVGHDLRSPLQAIVSSAQLLKKTFAPVDGKLYINIIKDSSEQLARLVDDLVGLARNEELSFVPEPLDLSVWLKKIQARFAVDAMRKELDFDVVQRSDLPVVMFDETRLNQCVGNLLSNAIRYTDAGSIHLTIEHRHISSLSGELLIDVDDTGRGIADKDQKRIFLPFVRASSLEQGKGLGLAIVSGIVRALNGKIALTSKLNVGSTFSVVLPVSYPCAPDPSAPESLASQDSQNKSANSEIARILIVDDDESLRTVFAAIVSDMGYLSDQAADGKEGFILAKCTNYHAIVTDIQMTGWDGFALAAACRRYLHPCPLLIAMTAYTKALNDDPRSSIFDQVLHKPVNEELLLAALEGAPSAR